MSNSWDLFLSLQKGDENLGRKLKQNNKKGE